MKANDDSKENRKLDENDLKDVPRTVGFKGKYELTRCSIPSTYYDWEVEEESPAISNATLAQTDPLYRKVRLWQKEKIKD